MHRTGVFGSLCGGAPKSTDSVEGPTLDVLVSDAVGTRTRFRSLEMAATGNPRHSNSLRDASNINPAETSALGLYTRIFGPGFADPNAAEFAPDPNVLLRQSALSIVAEDRKRLERQLGHHDRARLDQYFTALRQLEQQLVLQLKKPPPLEACSIPGAPVDLPADTEIDNVIGNHALMAEVLALALACDQTRVFNMQFSDRASSLRMPGTTDTHHTLTHEEPRDPLPGLSAQGNGFRAEKHGSLDPVCPNIACRPRGRRHVAGQLPGNGSLGNLRGQHAQRGWHALHDCRPGGRAHSHRSARQRRGRNLQQGRPDSATGHGP